MKKQNLISFIKKYYLNGSIDSVIWEISNNELKTKFILDDQSLLGNVVLKNFNHSDIKLGILNTNKLIKFLSALDEDIDFEIYKISDFAKTILFKDKNSNIKYVLANIDLINQKIPNVKELGEPTVIISIDKDFINKFIKIKSSFEKCDLLYITADLLTEKCKIVLTEGTVNDNIEINDIYNIFSIEVNTQKLNDLDKIYFNANLFKEILDVNKDFNEYKFEVYDKGLIYLRFDNDFYSSEYYLVAYQKEDI